MANGQLVQRLIHREMRLAVQRLLPVAPVQRGKGQLIRFDRATEVHGHSREIAQSIARHEIADDLVQRLIQHITKSPRLGRMIGEKEHRTRKIRITHRWGRK